MAMKQKKKPWIGVVDSKWIKAHTKRLKKTWGTRVFSAKEVDEMRKAELEGEEG